MPFVDGFVLVVVTQKNKLLPSSLFPNPHAFKCPQTKMNERQTNKNKIRKVSNLAVENLNKQFFHVTVKSLLQVYVPSSSLFVISLFNTRLIQISSYIPSLTSSHQFRNSCSCASLRPYFRWQFGWSPLESLTKSAASPAPFLSVYLLSNLSVQEMNSSHCPAFSAHTSV